LGILLSNGSDTHIRFQTFLKLYYLKLRKSKTTRKKGTLTMELYCGIDLHSNNGYYGIVQKSGKRVYSQRLPNDLPLILQSLEPFRKNVKSVAVESTYNWYWLVDGLMERGYNVKLANPSAMKQYEGLKNVNDKTDAFNLAEQLRLGILPTGHIYPKEERPVRDMLRRRMMFVQHRTAHVLSLNNLVIRQATKRV
jgi:transposase